MARFRSTYGIGMEELDGLPYVEYVALKAHMPDDGGS